MPRVDGWTVLEHVRESSVTAKIAIVVVSALSDARDAASYPAVMRTCSRSAPDVLYLQIRALSRIQSERRASRSVL